MSLQKICAHAALSFALVASVTSHAFNLQVPQFTGKQMFVGGAAVVAGVVVVGAVGYYGKKAIASNREMQKEAFYFRALKKAYGPIGTENDVRTNPRDKQKQGLPFWLGEILPVVEKISKDRDAEHADNGGTPRGAVTCFPMPLDK
jgi:hypothetical protein